jgi:hypothetical protein
MTSCYVLLCEEVASMKRNVSRGEDGIGGKAILGQWIFPKRWGI